MRSLQMLAVAGSFLLSIGVANAQSVFDGNWIIPELGEKSPTLTIVTQGDQLSYRDTTGESFTATFGGPEVPVIGGDPGTTASIIRTGPRSFRDSEKVNGRPSLVVDVSVSEDGQIQTFAFSDLAKQTTATMVAKRKP